MKVRYQRSLVLAASVFAIMLGYGCASNQPIESGAAPTSTAVWEGMSQASCNFVQRGRCNAQNRITLSLIQSGDRITGTYSCAAGNMDCLNGNDSGKIVAGELVGDQLRALRIAMPDGTGCIYSGTLKDANGQGSYQCTGGGAGSMIEQGSWALTRRM